MDTTAGTGGHCADNKELKVRRPSQAQDNAIDSTEAIINTAQGARKENGEDT